MNLILSIETSTACCSVALSNDTQVLHYKEQIGQNIHASMLTVFIDEVMKSSGFSYNDLGAVAVSMGPGSYTGLRIGVSTAKGICYAIDKPLIAINSLEAMAYGFNQIHKPIEQSLLCPMIDARRMEVYEAIYNTNIDTIRVTKATIVDNNSFAKELQDHQIYFFGNGAEKCKEVIDNPNVHFDEANYNSACFVAPLAYNKLKIKAFEDVAYFEPFYLKDFVTTQPKKKPNEK